MSVKAKFSAVLLLSGSLLAAAAADAQEVTVADFAAAYVSNAVYETKADIANGIYASVLHATYHFDINENEFKTEVLISQATPSQEAEEQSAD